MILCYHAVNPDWQDWLSVPPEAFAAHVDWLARHRLAHVEAAAEGADRGPLRRRPIAITFDDGFADLFDYALPIIRSYSLPATVYLVAGTLFDGQPVDWVDTPPTGAPLRTLSADQIAEMREAGVRFGSHTWTHPDLTTLDDAALDRELRDSREALSDLIGARVTTVAYPRGRHDEQVRRATRRAGYEFGLALPIAREPASRFAVPRVGIGGGDGVAALRIKSNPAFLSLRHSRVGAAAGRARALLSRAHR